MSVNLLPCLYIDPLQLRLLPRRSDCSSHVLLRTRFHMPTNAETEETLAPITLTLILLPP